MPSTYAVVNFVETDEVEIVPLSWLNDDGCVWPPLKAVDAQKLVKRLEKPSGDWMCHKAQVMEQYETYSDARAGLTKAEDTSDLNSDKENLGKGKRKRMLKSKDFPEDNCLPTKLQQKNLKRFKDQYQDLPYDNSLTFTERTGIVIPSLDDNILNYPMMELHSNSSTPDILPISHEMDEIPETAHVEVECIAGEQPAFISKLPILTDSSQEISTIKKSIQLLDERVKLVIANQDIILQAIQANSIPLCTTVQEGELGFSLPIADEDCLNLAEGVLNDPIKYEILVKKLSTCGGSTVDSCVKRILVKLLTNSLAVKYSWLGAKGKGRFSSLKIAEVVFNAVRRNPSVADKATDVELETSIKNWLRHAKARCAASLKNK